MGKNHRGHSDSDTYRSLYYHNRYLCREHDRFLASAIIAVRKLRNLRIIKDLLRKGLHAAFDVSGCSCTIACEEVTIVSLFLDEELSIREVYKSLVNRGIAMRMVFHGLSDDVGDLHETSIIHREERVHDSSLHRLKTIHEIRNSPVADYI